MTGVFFIWHLLTSSRIAHLSLFSDLQTELLKGRMQGRSRPFVDLQLYKMTTSITPLYLIPGTATKYGQQEALLLQSSVTVLFLCPDLFEK